MSFAMIVSASVPTLPHKQRLTLWLDHLLFTKYTYDSLHNKTSRTRRAHGTRQASLQASSCPYRPTTIFRGFVSSRASRRLLRCRPPDARSSYCSSLQVGQPSFIVLLYYVHYFCILKIYIVYFFKNILYDTYSYSQPLQH